MTIRVYKRERTLEAWRDGRIALRAGVSLGPNAEGRKLREGDLRTPEGEYFVCAKNALSRYYLSLGISYPNSRDARDALKRGEIAEEQAAAIVSAETERRRPDWDTPLGGFVMIHGEHPDGLTGDWTAGCVALKNADMRALFDTAEIGDGVEIYP
ncbi:MAG: L,D-transpeptidase family protein [Clostridiales bacterium]|nr:L,D-transpeptidase family protein [Clostridiales bacterium]